MKTLNIVGLATIVLLSACAMTYKGPVTISQNAEEKIDRPKQDIFKAARRALVLAGNQVLSADEQSGTISTMPRDYRLTPEQADCGTTMGIDYLKDNRTSTKLAYGVIVDDGLVDIRTNLQGEYKPGDVTQNITLTCVSRGNLERDLLSRIKAELR